MALRDLLADTRPLTFPDFRRLWVSNIVTVIGAQMTIVAIPAQLYAITKDSSFVGLAGLFGLVPLIVFGLYGGSWADRFDRRKLLLISTSGLVLSSLLLALWAFVGANVWVLLVTFALQQAFFAITQPARTAIVPKLVPGHLLPAANTLNMTLMTFGAVAGPVIGGMLIPVVGFSTLYLFDALSLLVTLWAVFKLPPLPPGDSAAEVVSPNSDPHPGAPTRTLTGFASVWEGFRYVRGRQILLVSFAVDIIAMVFGMPRAMFPQIANETFGGPASGGTVFALLSAAIAIGSTVGGMLSGWSSRLRSHGLGTMWAVTVWGAAIAATGLFMLVADSLWWVAIVGVITCLAVGGWADLVSMALRTSILQQAVEDRMRGRLQGLFLVVVAGGPRVADALHGFGASTFGTFWTMFGGGVLVIVLTWVVGLCAPAFLRYKAPPPQSIDTDP